MHESSSNHFISYRIGADDYPINPGILAGNVYGITQTVDVGWNDSVVYHITFLDKGTEALAKKDIS